jgi:hypothetical protein
MVRGRAREQELIGFLGGVGGGASMWSRGGGYSETGEFWGSLLEINHANPACACLSLGS